MRAFTVTNLAIQLLLLATVLISLLWSVFDESAFLVTILTLPLLGLYQMGAACGFLFLIRPADRQLAIYFGLVLVFFLVWGFAILPLMDEWYFFGFALAGSLPIAFYFFHYSWRVHKRSGMASVV